MIALTSQEGPATKLHPLPSVCVLPAFSRSDGLPPTGKTRGGRGSANSRQGGQHGGKEACDAITADYETRFDTAHARSPAALFGAPERSRCAEGPAAAADGSR